MSAIGQYLRETRAELRHVAWPTQTQTIVYTVLVAAISISIAAYLGFFDLLFTGALGRVVNNLPATTPTTQTISTSTPLANPTLQISTSTKK